MWQQYPKEPEGFRQHKEEMQRERCVIRKTTEVVLLFEVAWIQRVKDTIELSHCERFYFSATTIDVGNVLSSE